MWPLHYVQTTNLSEDDDKVIESPVVTGCVSATEESWLSDPTRQIMLDDRLNV